MTRRQMATQKDSKEYYDECLDKLETIKKGLTKIGKHQRDFLRLFIEQKEINKHEREYERFEEELKIRTKSFEKVIQRIYNNQKCSKAVYERICKLYEFLLKNKEYKKSKDVYKPLSNEKFEKEILGEKDYQNLKEYFKNHK